MPVEKRLRLSLRVEKISPQKKRNISTGISIGFFTSGFACRPYLYLDSHQFYTGKNYAVLQSF